MRRGLVTDARCASLSWAGPRVQGRSPSAVAEVLSQWQEAHLR